jgi:prepilin-type N-terminal cleavage/methylation domain-containing protein
MTGNSNESGGIKMIQYGWYRHQGVTVVEVLVVLAIIAILLSFSGSFVGRLAGQAELTVAEESVLNALRNARNLSRSSESSLTLSLSHDTGDLGYRISIKRPEGRQIGPKQTDVPEVYLPNGIVVLSENMTFTFDYRGLVEPTGSIMLRAEGNDDEIRKIFVNNWKPGESR